MRVCGARMVLGLGFLGVLPPFPVIFTPPMLHTHLNVPITGRANGWRLGTFKRQCRFENRGPFYSKVLSILLYIFQERNWIPDVYSSRHDAVLIFCWILPIVGGISDTRHFGSWCCFSLFWPSFCFKINGASWNLVNASLYCLSLPPRRPVVVCH